MATFLPADPTRTIDTTIQPANGRTFSLSELQGFVDGYIEKITLPDGRFMVLNEDGKDILPRNERATELAGFITAGEMRKRLVAMGDDVFFAGELPEDDDAPADYVCGDVLICEQSEVQ